MLIEVPFKSYPNLRFLAVIAGLLGTVSAMMIPLSISYHNFYVSMNDKLPEKTFRSCRADKAAARRVHVC